MSEDLHVPIDFERLHEFRLLTAALQRRAADGNKAEPRTVQAIAVFLWMRLWADLALLAKTTNRPGLLIQNAKVMFEESVDPLFGQDCNPIELLVEAQILERRGEDFFCGRFARANAHTAGDYVKREMRGAAASALERGKYHIQRDALSQAMLLPPEQFKKRDGSPMRSTEINRAMVIIKTLDNCLKRSQNRSAQDYGEALLADADAVAQAYADREEVLKEVYIWVMSHRGHAALPDSAEKILADFERIVSVARGA